MSEVYILELEEDTCRFDIKGSKICQLFIVGKNSGQEMVSLSLNNKTKSSHVDVSDNFISIEDVLIKLV